MKPIHKLILLGFMGLSVGTFIFGILQLAGPPTSGKENPQPERAITNASERSPSSF